MTPKDIFENQIATRLADPAQQAQAKELDAVYQFHVSGDNGGDWVVNMRECKVENGSSDEADCTISLADEDFVGLVKDCEYWYDKHAGAKIPTRTSFSSFTVYLATV